LKASSRGYDAMFKHVLIATDGSELATRALMTGLSLAESLGARATVVTVTEPRTNLIPDVTVVSFPATDYESALAMAAKTILANAGEEAGKLGISFDTVHLPNAYPAEGILKEAEARGCDVIVMASHGRRAVARALLGGEALRVVTNSTIPVLVCR
jgi:nucleotide-binding universal stress UspA family protein